MSETTRILVLSANPWTTSRILVDEEAREIFERLQEGTFRDQFVLYHHSAIRPSDIQRLLLMYRPQIVHFSGHGSRRRKLIVGGVAGRGKLIAREGLVKVLALYRRHVRLVFLNACFTRTHARSLVNAIDYSIGSSKPIGDKEGVAFAGAFYRALSFGTSVKEAFDSATAEVALLDMKRAHGLQLFNRKGLNQADRFPQTDFGQAESAAEPRLTSRLLPAGTDHAEFAGDWLSVPSGNLPAKIERYSQSDFAGSNGITRPRPLVFFSYSQTTEQIFGQASVAGRTRLSITRNERRKLPSINRGMKTRRQTSTLTAIGLEPHAMTSQANTTCRSAAKSTGFRNGGARRQAGKRSRRA